MSVESSQIIVHDEDEDDQQLLDVVIHPSPNCATNLNVCFFLYTVFSTFAIWLTFIQGGESFPRIALLISNASMIAVQFVSVRYRGWGMGD